MDAEEVRQIPPEGQERDAALQRVSELRLLLTRERIRELQMMELLLRLDRACAPTFSASVASDCREGSQRCHECPDVRCTDNLILSDMRKLIEREV